MASSTTAVVCPECDRVTFHPAGPGRPRRYCSSTCRTKAHYRRRRPPEPPSLDELVAALQAASGLDLLLAGKA